MTSFRSMLFRMRKSSARGSSYPAGPEGITLYAIGDIHGRLDCLERAHGLIERDRARLAAGGRVIEIYLGDYIDRGPDSKGVVDRLIERSKTADLVLLRGNHEIMMESFLRGETSFEKWRSAGGLETALSYGVDVRDVLQRHGMFLPKDLAERVPSAHLQFMSALESFRRFGQYYFVHAGLRPGVPLDRQTIDDLAWIREDFLDFRGDFGCIVVHGHSPVPAVEFLPNRINIDTGAFATNRLAVVRIDNAGPSIVEG